MGRFWFRCCLTPNIYVVETKLILCGLRYVFRAMIRAVDHVAVSQAREKRTSYDGKRWLLALTAAVIIF